MNEMQQVVGQSKKVRCYHFKSRRKESIHIYLYIPSSFDDSPLSQVTDVKLLEFPLMNIYLANLIRAVFAKRNKI